MKMTEFRSRQPLDDDDFAAIRRNVMTTIATRRTRRFLPVMMRFALAAAVVSAIGLAFFLRRPAASPAAVTHKEPAPAIETLKAAVQVPPAQVVASLTAMHPVARVTHTTRHHREHSPSEFAVAAQQNIRVEFRTSDPDVRIIWIANQTPRTTGGKS